MQNRTTVGNILPIFSTCAHLRDFVDDVSKNLNIDLSVSVETRENKKLQIHNISTTETDYCFPENLKFSVEVIY